jgi:hypothetical protein
LRNFSANKLLKILHDFNVTKPAERLSGRKLSKERNIKFDDIYRQAQYLRDKGLIELKESKEIGRVGPVDIHMKITASGIDYLGSNRFIKKLGRGIGKLLEVLIKIFK